MRPRRHLMAGLLALATAGGCGDSGNDPEIPLADLPPKLAQALCSAYDNCYGPVFELFLNGADCVSTTEARIRNGTFPMLQGEIDQGKVVYDGRKAQACLDSFRRLRPQCEPVVRPRPDEGEFIAGGDRRSGR